MKKEFIPYEQALALKELGFDEECLGHYHNAELIYHIHTNNEMQRFRYASPLYQQTFRWFREKHNLFHEIQIDRTTEPKFCFDVFQYEHFGNYKEIRIGEWYLYRTQEEAELECLKELIEIVKEK